MKGMLCNLGPEIGANTGQQCNRRRSLGYKIGLLVENAFIAVCKQ